MLDVCKGAAILDRHRYMKGDLTDVEATKV